MTSSESSSALWRKSSHSNGQANCVEVATVQGDRAGWPSVTARLRTARA
jgi:Domain of unknown function (DUF397)